MSSLPSGTVTFLFTDIEGSTKLAQSKGDKWESLHARHHEILKSAIESNNGYVFQIIGDAFCATFHTVGDALNAAIQSQTDFRNENWNDAPIKVRMGIHTGKAELHEDGQYQGYLTMSRVQRVMSVAYGEQTLLSNTSAELIRGELPENITLLDLKEHRLKGVLNPERLWQVVSPNLRKDFPPLKSLNDIPNNLPIQLTSFIGREKEIADLKQELNIHRLVTLTGSGGTGKTRLSLEIAAEAIDMFPDGVWFLELAPVNDSSLVPYTLANILGLRESADTKQTIDELVCGYFHSRKALVLFDNCEHLIESCAHFVNLLLRSCKDLKILASSREALGVEGEMAWQVLSLSMPDIKQLPAIEHLSQYEAVRLFIERASLVQPHFSVTKENAPAIVQICHRLDGIPLAIELAAARVNVLTLEQIANRLDDRFRLLTGGARTVLPRHKTLHAMIDWSYNLLSEEERLLFKRLAVFVGGWSLEAAEAVCSGEEIESYLVLDLLSQLVNKSLVTVEKKHGESRYHRLETIRQYARDKLFETDDARLVRDRHLDYYIQLADQGFEELTGPKDLIWIEKLEMDHDNFRAALSWVLESPDADPQKALQLTGALQDFWDTRGYTSEGYQWLSMALEKASDMPTPDRCRALIGAGLLCIRTSRGKEASKFIEAALNLARQLNIAPLIIRSLLYSWNVFELQEDSMKRYEEGMALARATRNQYFLAWSLAEGPGPDITPDTIRPIEEAYEIAEKLGNARLRAFVLWNYGRIEIGKARYDLGTSLLEESLRLSQLLKQKHQTAHCLLSLGVSATRQAHYDDAVRYEEESQQIFRDLSDRVCVARSQLWLGWNSFLSGEIGQAIEQLEECLFTYREIEVSSEFVPLVFLGRIFSSQGNIQKAKSCFLDALPLMKKSTGWTNALVYCLEGICALPGIPPDKIARLLGKTEAFREKEAFVFPISERHLIDPIIEELKSQLGKDAFDSACAIGMELTHEQAIDEAMDALQIIE